jgi:hypothetical protein
MTDIPEDPTPEQVQRLIDACPEAAPIAEYVCQDCGLRMSEFETVQGGHVIRGEQDDLCGPVAKANAGHRSPKERWGTCCPSDPHCEHSFLESPDLFRWMNTPISDAVAAHIDGSPS